MKVLRSWLEGLIPWEILCDNCNDFSVPIINLASFYNREL